MKRCLITGGSGFVGANLARYLLQRGNEIHLLMRPDYNPWRVAAIQSQVQIHCVEMTDAETTAAVVGAVRPEWVFHLAAYGAYSSQTNIHQMVNTNIVSTINLVQASLQAGVEAFINTGSSSEYGFKSSAPHEREWIDPNSHYAVTKAAATLYCRQMAQTHPMRIITLRLYSVYGPYEEPTRLFPTLILHGLAGLLPPLVSPAIAHDYVYCEDVNRAYELAATQPEQEKGAVFNIGTGRQTTLREIVDIARKLLSIHVEPEWGSMPNRQWDTDVWVCDNRAAQSVLGWQPQFSIENGLAETIVWFRSDAAMSSYYRNKVKSSVLKNS